MGLAQACALVPGVSRSGATISMGRFLGYDREAATRYAFLLAIPAVVGAGLFELKEIPHGDNSYGWGPTIVGDRRVASSSGTPRSPGCCATSSTHSYPPFVIYRIVPRRSDAGAARRPACSPRPERPAYSQPDLLKNGRARRTTSAISSSANG